jgi:hypothetical protein
VAASGTTDDLRSLEEARARLEAALADDENWRALQQPAAPGDAAEAGAARQARNTRLKMALADNPLYQAWRHLGEAIAARRAGDAHARPAAAGATLPHAPPVAHRPAAPPSKPAQAQRGAQASPTTEPAQASAAPRVGRAIADPEEAEVTFVRREPLLPSARLPADLGTERASALFERLRDLEEEEQTTPAPETTFVSPDDAADEAEVTIVSPEDARLQERADAIRRLRKTLSGD